MTITLSANTVSGNAPRGTLVGVLSETHSKKAAYYHYGSSYFALSGNRVLTHWSGNLLPGVYNFGVLAYGMWFFDHAVFPITVTGPGSRIVGDPSTIVEVPLTKGE